MREDYEQAIVNEWELETLTRRYKTYDSEWHTRVYSDFEEPIRISFKSDGTYFHSQDTVIYTDDSYYEWLILGDCLSLCHGFNLTPYVDYCHCEVTEGPGNNEDHVEFRGQLGEDVTIEQLTHSKLVLFEGNESREFKRWVFKKI